MLSSPDWLCELKQRTPWASVSPSIKPEHVCGGGVGLSDLLRSLCGLRVCGSLCADMSDTKQ